MFRNHLRTAFRSLWRARQFSVLNVLGLALGLTVFLFITQYVAYEWSANRFHKSFKQLYRANVLYKDGHTDNQLPPGFAPIVAQRFPQVQSVVRVADGIANGVMTYKAAGGDKIIRTENAQYADGNFLSVFSFPLLAGTAPFDAQQTMAISEGLSQKFFGTTDAVGKTLLVSNQFGNTPYTVKAVYQIPAASDLQPEALLSLQTLATPAGRSDNDWADPSTTQSGFTAIYLRLKEGADAASLADGIIRFIRTINPASKDDRVYLQPFSELHLAPSFNYPYQTYGNLLLLVVFAGVALLILGIAWINYVNLSTAQALYRTKEIGMRKVLGAGRAQVAIQFLSETLLLTLASLSIAMVAVSLLQPAVNGFTGKPLSLSVLNNGWFWVGGAALIVLGSLVSGGYVAFVANAFGPLQTVRSKGDVKWKGLSVRKGLVVFQFAASVLFIIATLVLYKQLRFMETGNLGMSLTQRLVIKGPTVSTDGQAEKNAVFKNTLANLPFVEKFAASNNVPGVGYNFTSDGIGRLTATDEERRKSFAMFICDDRYFDTYGIQFLQGRPFAKEEAERSWNNDKKVVINERAARQLGFDPKQNLVGQKISWGQPYEIIGVVKDYHHLSLREAIPPMIFLGSVSFGYFTVQTDTKGLPGKIETLRKLYTDAFPGNVFEYFFADEKFGEQYRSEQQLGKVFIGAAVVAMLIACLGLFGLSAYAARRRVKEIGIRKVLGASAASIAALLSRDFLKLVVIALLIASPLAWWLMGKWLQNFSYRTSVGGWVFVLTAAAAIGIALLTVSFQSVKAACLNPVNNLRNE